MQYAPFVTVCYHQADLRNETLRIGDVVSVEEGRSYARENGLEFFEGAYARCAVEGLLIYMLNDG